MVVVPGSDGWTGFEWCFLFLGCGGNSACPASEGGVVESRVNHSVSTSVFLVPLLAPSPNLGLWQAKETVAEVLPTATFENGHQSAPFRPSLIARAMTRGKREFTHSLDY